MKNIFVLVTILGHLPVILSAKRKGSDNMKQILIVEDDNLLNKTLTYNLELDGYTITSVLNARTAAESLKTNIFDLVLLDINLPDGNGYDLCRLIKPEHPDTVVIFLRTKHPTTIPPNTVRFLNIFPSSNLISDVILSFPLSKIKQIQIF